MWPGESPPVATWLSRGWKRWKLRRSTSATDMGARPRALATYNPPNPPPTITTRCDGAVWDFTGCWMLAGGSAMLLGRCGAIARFRLVYWHTALILFYTSDSETQERTS